MCPRVTSYQASLDLMRQSQSESEIVLRPSNCGRKARSYQESLVVVLWSLIRHRGSHCRKFKRITHRKLCVDICTELKENPYVWRTVRK